MDRPAEAARADQPGARPPRRAAGGADAEPDRRAITRFAGSMAFVYLHVIWFACWIGFGVEKYPFGLLTMIVSLEAIFLSRFVMISQNRADAKRQVIAEQQWTTVQEEDNQNRELLDLSKQILELTKAVHAYATAASGQRPDAGPTATASNRTEA
jgi:uncharacterized membrane protein